MKQLRQLEEDVSTLRTSSQKVFDYWNDSVSENVKKECLDKILKKWQDVSCQINVQLKILEHAQKELNESLDKAIKLREE